MQELYPLDSSISTEGSMIHTAVTKSKFKKLKRRLGVPHYAVVGVLETIWHIGSASCQDGAIGRMSNEDIAAEIEWAGNPDELIQSLVDCGWLDSCPVNRLVIHDWAEHCPRFVKGAMAKHNKKFAIQAPAVASCFEQPAIAPCHSTVPPNLTKPNLTKPNQIKTVVSCSPDGDTPPILTYPCNGNPSKWFLTQSQVDEWIALYAGVDVLAECRKALGWLNARTMKKTARGMPRFLTSWLSRASDRPRSGFQPPQNSLGILAEKRDIIGRVGQIPEDDPILASMRRSIRPNPATFDSLPSNLTNSGRSALGLGNQSSLEDRSSNAKIDGNNGEVSK